MIPLGPFALDRPIGSGGRGVVWSAVHRETGLPVAVKLLRQVSGASGRPFEQEVRAVASLRHDHVVTVYDHARVDPAAAAASDGALEEGQPYLAMELGEEALAQRIGRLAWPEIREVLLAILAGLGHAHARGLVHLDVKPENVILGCSEGGLAAGLRLADFGLSRPAGERGAAAGTPAFMAPEQSVADGELGPWTDLYAVGCITWELCCGAPVFSGTLAEVVGAHRGRDPGAFLPVTPVPRDLEAWARSLLVKSVAARPRFAADASAALRSLGGPLVGGPGTSSRAEPALTFDFGWDAPEVVAPRRVPSAPPIADRALDPAPIPRELADPTPRRRTRLLDAGLGLLRDRRLPVVGWVEARRALWAALLEARTRAVRWRVEGPAGSATRVARWLAEHADEVGAAWVIRASEGIDVGARRLLRRSTTAVGTDLASALVDAARGRPLLVVVDHERGADLARSLAALAAVRAVPALVLLTDAVDETAAKTLVLPEQDAVDVRRLLREALELAPSFVDRIVEGCDGDADVAVAMVEELARDGRLLPGRDGYAPAAGAPLRPPSSHEARWMRRARELEPSADGPAWIHLERAATWGAPFASWEELGLDGGPVVDRLARAGLVEQDLSGWALEPPLVAEALLAHARARGRAEDHHRALLQVGAGGEERRGEWLVGLGRVEDGATACGAALIEAWNRRRATPAHAARFRAALGAAGVPDDDERWGILQLHELWITSVRRWRGLLERALALAAQADLAGWVQVGFLARRIAASAFGGSARAEPLLRRTVEDATGVNAYRYWSAVNNLGSWLIRRGRMVEAREQFERVVASGDPMARLGGINLAAVDLEQGRPLEVLARAEGWSPAESDALTTDAVERLVVRAALTAGRVDEAAARARELARRTWASGHWSVYVAAEALVAASEVAAGEVEVAVRRLERLLELDDALDLGQAAVLVDALVAADRLELASEAMARTPRFEDDGEIAPLLLAAACSRWDDEEALLLEWERHGGTCTTATLPLLARAVASWHAAGRRATAERVLGLLRERWTANGQLWQLHLAVEADLLLGVPSGRGGR